MLRTGVIAVILSALQVTAPMAAAGNAREPAVKAAILYNLARFSNWTLTHDLRGRDYFEICVEDEALAAALKEIRGRSLLSKPLKISKMSEKTDAYFGCQMTVFAEESSRSPDLNALAERGVMTVGSDAEFLRNGGGIALFRDKNNIKFSIRKDNLARAGIQPSSKILRLSKVAPK